MAPDLDASTWDHTDAARYGCGTERPLAWFYRLFLIDVQARQTVPGLCKVSSGVTRRHVFLPRRRHDV